MKTENKNGQDYQQRAKNETERYKLAVNSDFWLCFSFSDEGYKNKFDGLFGESAGGYLYGDTIKINPPAQEKRRIGSKNKHYKMNTPPSEPWNNLRECDGTLNDDAVSCSEALMAAFEIVDNATESDSIFGSNIYSVVIFRDQSSKEKFSEDYKIEEVESYTNGDKFLASIE